MYYIKNKVLYYIIDFLQKYNMEIIIRNFNFSIIIIIYITISIYIYIYYF